MTARPWQADPAVIAAARAAFDAALGAFEAALTRQAVIDTDPLARLLRAAGTLVTLDVAESVRERLAAFADRAGLSRAAVAAVLEREDLSDALEDSAARLRSVLTNDDENEGFADDCAALLEIRDHAETELLGAALVLACEPEALAASSSARWVWDDVVRPESWRLVAINGLRRAALENISPRSRARFWWWSDGVALPKAAIGALGAAAQLVARFPNARLQFESLVKAEAIWTSSLRERAQDVPADVPANVPANVSTNVITLRGWLSRRSSSPAISTVPLAAAAGDEHLVFETPELQISFAAPAQLIVDLIADRRGDALPSLLTSSGEVMVAKVVAVATERFAFELTERILDDPRATLSVPLAAGDRHVVLPAPEHE